MQLSAVIKYVVAIA